MSSPKSNYKRIQHVPIVSSFGPPDRSIVHSPCTTRQMTPEERAYYGPPNQVQRNKNYFEKTPKKRKPA